MQIKPLNDRVLVKRLDEETTTPGGIIIPDNNKEKPAQGKVISIGPGHRNEDGSFASLNVKEGDRVIFGKYAGSEVKLESNEYLIMKEDDILGIIQ